MRPAYRPALPNLPAMPLPSNPAQASLPDVLQARLRLGLRNWAKRTLLWSAFLAIFSVHFPALKFVLLGWIVFSALSLALLLAGLKLARNLKGGTTFSFGMGGMGNPVGQMPGPFAQSGSFASAEDVATPQAAPDDPPPRARGGASNEVIEIDAEVLPPEEPESADHTSHRQPKPREIYEG